MLKWKSIVIVALFLLPISANAHAALINQSVYATIESITLDPHGNPILNPFGMESLIGEMVHLFDIQYDNEGTEMHEHGIYYGTPYTNTYDITHPWYSAYEFMSDASFSLSPFLEETRSLYGGDEAYFTGWKYQAQGLPDRTNMVFQEHDISLFVAYYETNQVSGTLDLYNPTSVHPWGPDYGYIFEQLQITFGEPSNVSASASVPEPATMLLLGAGFLGVIGTGRKKLFRK